MAKAKPVQEETTNEPSDSQAADAGQEQATRPVAKFSGSGGLNVAVWKHRPEEGAERYSVRIERSYKADDGYHTTPYLREGDLLRASNLLEQADNWIEQDKAKYRASQGQSR